MPGYFWRFPRPFKVVVISYQLLLIRANIIEMTTTMMMMIVKCGFIS